MAQDNTKEREVRQGGVFDQKPESAPQPPPAGPAKEDFHEPSATEIQNKAATRSLPSKADQYQDDAAAHINKAMDGGGLYDDVEISEEDIKLAEKLIFDGFAETEISLPNFPGHTFTICSTSAEELSVMDEVLFDYVKTKENNDGTIDLPQNHISTMRSALFLALGYRGRDREEVSKNASEHLNTIKKAAMRVNDMEMGGDIENAEKLKASLKKALLGRAVHIKRMPTPMIDFLSNEKYKFDRRMYKIMSIKEIVPKS